MVNESLIAWAVGAMLQWTLPAVQHDAARERYAAIAKDAAEVAFDRDEPPVFAGPSGRVRTLALLLAVASYESDFADAVDRGEKRGDHGRSWCLMQVNLGGGRIVLDGPGWRWPKAAGEGLTGVDLVDDRRTCFRVGLHMARASYRTCRDLSLYTSGRCRKDEPKARQREARAVAMLKRWPVPGVDADYLPDPLAFVP